MLVIASDLKKHFDVNELVKDAEALFFKLLVVFIASVASFIL